MDLISNQLDCRGRKHYHSVDLLAQYYNQQSMLVLIYGFLERSFVRNKEQDVAAVAI